jgi:hypothetical protein
VKAPPNPRIRTLCLIAAWFVLSVAYHGFFLVENGYLPAPFFHAASQPFTDYYATADASYDHERYTLNYSIYPVFTFLLANLTSNKECYFANFSSDDNVPARDNCTDFGLYLMFILAILAAFQNARLFTKDRVEQLLFFLLIVLSFPFLFGLDRANFILYAYVFLVLAASIKGKVSEGIFLACAINLKQYLLVLLAHAFLNRDYKVLLSCAVATAVLTATAAVYLKEPHFMLFWENMFAFADPDFIGSIFWVGTSAMSPYLLVEFTQGGAGAFWLDYLDYLYPEVGGERLVWLASVLQIVIYGTIGFVGLRMLQLGRALEKDYVSYVMLLCLFAKFQAPGPYALILLFPFLPSILPVLNRVDLCALFLIMQSFDFQILRMWETQYTSYYTGAWVSTSFGLSVGTVLRPTALLVLFLSAAWRLARWPREKTSAGAREIQTQSLEPGSSNAGR